MQISDKESGRHTDSMMSDKGISWILGSLSLFHSLDYHDSMQGNIKKHDKILKARLILKRR